MYERSLLCTVVYFVSMQSVDYANCPPVYICTKTQHITSLELVYT